MGEVGLLPRTRTEFITTVFVVLFALILLPIILPIWAVVYLVAKLKRRCQKAFGERKRDSKKIQEKDLHITDQSNYYEKLYKYASEDNLKGFTTTLNTLPATSEREILSQLSPQNNTLLHVAASFGSPNLAKKIVDQDRSILFAKNDKDDTALHIAARKGKLSMVETLINLEVEPTRSLNLIQGQDAGIQNDQSSPILHKIQNNERNSALHEGLIHRREAVAEFLIEVDDDMVAHFANEEGKSPLYLAAEAGYVELVKLIKERAVRFNKNIDLLCEGKSPMHAAVSSRNEDMLWALSSIGLSISMTKDEREMTPLHHAASIGYLKGVFVIEKICMLFGQSKADTFQPDSEGNFPIHTASSKGYVDIIQELLQHFPVSKEFKNKDGQNILHVAAKCNKDNVVKYVLMNRQLEDLFNQKDIDGDTPLHLATKYRLPMIVSSLTWNKNIDLNRVDNEGFTALDIAEGTEHISSILGYLTWIALKSAGARRARQMHVNSQTPSIDSFKERVNTLLLVTILVSTVTFAAGFTMPGGYNSSEPSQGMATMLAKHAFQVYVICDTIAMYISIIVAVTLIWAQLGDLNLVVPALHLALPLLGFALTMMSVAFTAGVYLVVSNLQWLGLAVLGMGSIFLAVVLILFIPLFFPSYSTNCIIRYITYYPFRLVVSVSGNYNHRVEESSKSSTIDCHSENSTDAVAQDNDGGRES